MSIQFNLYNVYISISTVFDLSVLDYICHFYFLHFISSFLFFSTPVFSFFFFSADVSLLLYLPAVCHMQFWHKGSVSDQTDRSLDVLLVWNLQWTGVTKSISLGYIRL